MYPLGADVGVVGGGLEVVVPQQTLDDYGLYAQVVWGFSRPWTLGLRYDYAKGETTAFDLTPFMIDQTYDSEKDPFRKTFFLEQFLTQAMGVFGITRQAAIEQATYDAVKAGKIQGPDDLDALAKKIGTRYSMWFEKHDDLKMEWIDVHHFFDSPMYYVNYVFANFLALKYYEMYQRDPKAFVPNYIAMVRNGFNGTPTEILGKFLGFKLQDPKLVADAFSILDSKVKELRGLYSQRPAGSRKLPSVGKRGTIWDTAALLLR